MRLTVLGCSPAYPNPGGRSSGYLLEHDGAVLLLDCGHGVAGRLRDSLDIRGITAIVLSHMHPDHFFDLVPLRYAYASVDPEHRTPLWLPPGGEAVLDSLYGPLGLKEGFFSDAYRIFEYEPWEVLTIGELEIRFALTRHYIPAYAMRITPRLKQHPAFFYSSDTAWAEALLPLAHGVDVALVEAGEDPEQTPTDGMVGHLTGGGAGRLAKTAGAARLLLTHYDSRCVDRQISQAGETFDGPVTAVHEGDIYAIE